MKVVLALVFLALSAPAALATTSCERELDTLRTKMSQIDKKAAAHAASLSQLLSTPTEQITIRMIRDQRRQAVRLCTEFSQVPGLLTRSIRVAQKPSCKGQVTSEAMNGLLETRSKMATAISECAAMVSSVRGIERGMKVKQRKPGSSA